MPNRPRSRPSPPQPRETHPPMPDLAITPTPAARVPRRERPVTIYDLSFDALEAKMGELGAPKYRAKQIWDWVYGQQVTGWDEMRNLPADLREKLAEAIPFSTMRLI